MIRAVLLAVAVLLLLIPKPDGKQGSPVDGGEAAALEMRAAICERLSTLAAEHAARVDHEEFKGEAAECKAFADQAGPIIKQVTEDLSKKIAALYAETRELEESQRPQARGSIWHGFAKGMKQ